MPELAAKKIKGRAVPKKHNRPHTRLHVMVETPFAEKLQSEYPGFLDSILHEALCKHYDLSPVTMQPKGGNNRYYVRSGWVPTVYVWMWRFANEKNQTADAARELAIARYHKYLAEGTPAPYTTPYFKGAAHIGLAVPVWAAELRATGKARLPTVDEVVAMVPKPANYKFVPIRARDEYHAALERYRSIGMTEEDALEYALAAAYVERLRTA